jgi:hypothetical protein
MCREAQRAIVIDLSGRMGVCNRENARGQHKGNTENSQDSRPGKPCPALCCHETHVTKDYSLKGTLAPKSGVFRHPAKAAAKKAAPAVSPDECWVCRRQLTLWRPLSAVRTSGACRRLVRWDGECRLRPRAKWRDGGPLHFRQGAAGAPQQLDALLRAHQA